MLLQCTKKAVSSKACHFEHQQMADLVKQHIIVLICAIPLAESPPTKIPSFKSITIQCITSQKGLILSYN